MQFEVKNVSYAGLGTIIQCYLVFSQFNQREHGVISMRYSSIPYRGSV